MGEHGQELQFIVDRLNEPPFQMSLTIVAFDEKTPFELLEVVNMVMADLSSQHSVDLRDETPDATATRTCAATSRRNPQTLAFRARALSARASTPCFRTPPRKGTTAAVLL